MKRADLEQLRARIKDESTLTSQDMPEVIDLELVMVTVWHLTYGNKTRSYRVSTDRESPTACFDLLDKMEAAGHKPNFVFSDGQKKYFAWDARNRDDSEGKWGKTRTEAVAALFVATMPLVNEVGNE